MLLENFFCRNSDTYCCLLWANISIKTSLQQDLLSFYQDVFPFAHHISSKRVFIESLAVLVTDNLLMLVQSAPKIIMCSSLNQVFLIDGISYLTKAAYRNGFSKWCPNVEHFAQECLKKCQRFMQLPRWSESVFCTWGIRWREAMNVRSSINIYLWLRRIYLFKRKGIYLYHG